MPSPHLDKCEDENQSVQSIWDPKKCVIPETVVIMHQLALLCFWTSLLETRELPRARDEQC